MLSDKSDYQIQLDNKDGQVHWAGASTNPDGTDGTFINVCFSYNPTATNHNTTVYLKTIRINEEDEQKDVGQTDIHYLVGIIDKDKLPSEFALNQNYPNPFNPNTTFNYELPKESKVILSVYDITGCLIETLVNTIQSGGYYSVNWNASQFSSGVYFYRIQADGFQQVKKCLLIK